MPSEINFDRFREINTKKSSRTPLKGSVFFVLAVIAVLILIITLILGRSADSSPKKVNVAWKWHPGKRLEYNLRITRHGDQSAAGNCILSIQPPKEDTLIQAFFNKPPVMRSGKIRVRVLTGLTWKPELTLPAFYMTSDVQELGPEILAFMQVFLTLHAEAVTEEFQDIKRFPIYYDVRKKINSAGSIAKEAGYLSGKIRLDNEAKQNQGRAMLLLEGFTEKPSGVRWFNYKMKLDFDINPRVFLSCQGTIYAEQNLLYSVRLERKKNWISATSSRWRKIAHKFIVSYNNLEKQIKKMPGHRPRPGSGKSKTPSGLVKKTQGNTNDGSGPGGQDYDEYTVRAGDALGKISRKFYGTSNKYQLIMDFNGMTSDRIRVGQKLKIPRLKPKKRFAPKKSSSRVPPPPRRRGETSGKPGPQLDY